MQLIKLKKNYEAIGYSATEVSLHLNKIYSLPIYLTLTTIIGAILMFKLKRLKSDIVKRRRIAKAYNSNLSNTSLVLPTQLKDFYHS